MIDGTIAERVPYLPETLDRGTQVGPYSCAKPGMLLRVVPGVGRFLARDGAVIEYCTEPGADPAAVEALLEGGVLGALIHQRGELPLHASTLVSPERTRAIAIAGDSGAGKSTTAFALLRRGWMMVSDDLTRVTLDDGNAIAWPGRTQLRLLADACQRFGLDVATLTPAPNWPDKYVVDVERWNAPVALSAIVTLERTDGPFTIDVMEGVAAVRALAEQTYRIHYVTALGQARRHLELVTATAATAQVLRARGRAAVDDVASAIAAAIRN